MAVSFGLELAELLYWWRTVGSMASHTSSTTLLLPRIDGADFGKPAGQCRLCLLLLHLTQNVIFTTSFLQLPIIALAGSSLLLLFTWPHNHRRIPGVSRFFSVLGRYSYLIFLSHTLIIRLVFSLIEGSVSPLQWGAASMIFVAAWYISLWLMKFPSKKNKVSP
jgi:peptidoglycan/LPS O-acetylase OafA/YrhL